MPVIRPGFKTLATAAALAAAVSLPVHAQDSSLLISQLQELLEEVRELRGTVEEQQRQIETLQQRQRAQFIDLDQRLNQLAGGAAGSAAAASAAPGSSLSDFELEPRTAPATWPDEPSVAAAPRPAEDLPEVRAPIDAPMQVTPLASSAPAPARDLGTPTAEEQAAYDRAFRALREQRFADAAQGFSDFLDTYPDSVYAPNALYWLAETYYVTRDFNTALVFFQELRSRYPRSNKDGDALLKIGFSHFELRQWVEARAALEQVRSEHANTTLARLAETRLRDMRLAGHF